MTIKTIEEKIEVMADNIEAISNKINSVIDKLTNRRYEDEIQAQAARIRFLQEDRRAHDTLVETIRRVIKEYSGEVE